MKPSQYPVYLSRELVMPEVPSSGSNGPSVRRVQEWLCYHGFNTAIDGEFGHATVRALDEFQSARALSGAGTVNPQTWDALVSPLATAVADVAGSPIPYAAACLSVGRQHLGQRPIELGGDNCGPWVRSYMGGREGANWYWCAGFVSFLLFQASLQLEQPAPIAGSVSCDTLAAQAREADCFISGVDLARGRVAPERLGQVFVFLVKRTPTDWTHAGLGFDLNGATFKTIEGNTNDDGSRNGYEVCSRVRSLAGKDFIRIS